MLQQQRQDSGTPQPVPPPSVPDLFASAVRHHLAGQLPEAEQLYRHILTLDPRHPDSLHLLGVAAYQTGRLTAAVGLIGQAIASNATVAAYHSNLGNALRDLGRLNEAAASFRQALALNPNLAEAHTNLGGLLAALGRPEEAIACHRKALALSPHLAAAHANLGKVLQELGRLDQAVPCFRTALDLQPDHPPAHFNLAAAFAGQGRFTEAEACYHAAIQLMSAFPEAHYNLGNVLREQGRPDEAAACYRRVIELSPDFSPAWNNLGHVLWDQDRLEPAALAFRRALDTKPDSLEAHNNLANTLQQQGRLDEAVALYRAALAIDPHCPESHMYLGIALLAQGDLTAGWREYEWRTKTAEGITTHWAAPLPQWRGQPAAGQTVLIDSEGGFGDTIHFCRYAALAAAAGLCVILRVQPPLVRLLQDLPGVHRVMSHDERLPAFDLYCPMLSLPLALRTTLATIPSAESYLHADAAQVAAWQTRLDATGHRGRRIGLVWAGEPRTHLPCLAAIDRRRSMPPERLRPLFAIPGIFFVSLQKDGPAAPDNAPLADFMQEMQDFADTAALIANLDLVISVDTAVAHLAAALGKPVWLLNRFDSCWRWLTARRDSPWYPTLRLYRQPAAGDWDSVVAEVAADLSRRISPESPR